jgi:hypothetical protein
MQQLIKQLLDGLLGANNKAINRQRFCDHYFSGGPAFSFRGRGREPVGEAHRDVLGSDGKVWRRKRRRRGHGLGVKPRRQSCELPHGNTAGARQVTLSFDLLQPVAVISQVLD